METGSGVAGLIIGAVTAGALWLGHLLTRRGQKESNHLASAAMTLEALFKRADMAEAGEARERARAERAEEELDTTRDEWRGRYRDQEQTHRAELIAQAAKCRNEMKQIEDTMRLLLELVHNDVARAAGLQTLDEILSHPHDEESQL